MNLLNAFRIVVIIPVLCGLAIFPAREASARSKGYPATEVNSAFGTDVEPLILDTIGSARKEIRIAVYTFAKKSFSDALIAQAKRGVKVLVKLDAREAQFEYTVGLIVAMKQAKVSVELIQMPPRDKMHHKFMVVDGTTVVTGSFNWTRQASDLNYENVVLIRSAPIALEFSLQWDRIKNRQ